MKPKITKPAPPQWHAVSIVCKTTSCPAAQRLGGTRFLSRKAPSLPLPDCDRPARCQCTYRKHEDRRQGPRRQEDKVGLRRPRKGDERRASADRRRSD
jgi:hypothetical protein